jgi:hypothetical protein
METWRMGHIGLPESMGMIFYTLGRNLVEYECDVEPVIDDFPVNTDYFEIQPDLVRVLNRWPVVIPKRASS